MNNSTNSQVHVKRSKKKVSPFRKLFVECLKKTSVRGMPRIFTAKTLAVRMIWIVAVISLLGCLTYNLVKLTIIFVRGDTIIMTLPWRPNPKFPAITVCDLGTMHEYGMRKLGLTPREYARQIKEKAVSKDTETSRNILEELLSPKAYYDHLDEHSLHDIDHDNSIILSKSCIVYYAKGGFQHAKPCRRIEKISVPGYHTCSKISLKDIKKATVFRVVFHSLIDTDPSSLRCKTCMFEDVQTMASGAILFMHEEDTYPMEIDHGLRLQASTQNIIGIKPTKKIKAKNCENLHEQKRLSFYMGDNLYNQSYTLPVCHALSRHVIFKKLCGCGDTSLPVLTTHGEHEDVKSCLKQDLNAESLNTSNLECIMKLELKLPLAKEDKGKFPTMRELIKFFKDRCPTPCIDINFPVVVSSSKGITKSSTLDIFERYIRNSSQFKRMKDRLEVYEEALTLRDSDPENATQLLQSTSFLEDNFFTVDIRYSSSKARVSSEKFVLSMSAFISQIGGTLAFFSGITLICIAELVEFIYLLLALFKDRYCVKKKEAGDDEESVPLS